MNYATLPIRQKQLTLPEDWLKDFPTDTVAAVRFGDVLMIRPVATVAYEPEAEAKVLAAVAAFEEAERQGQTIELGDKTFDELMTKAESLS